MGETVGIYRDSGHSSETRIGRGTIGQHAAVAVKGSGSILKMHVQVGDYVERGELLFETVEGALDGLYAMDNTIVSSLDGIVATVEATQGSHVDKNGKLLTVYPKDSMQIEMKVSELDLNDVHEGDRVSIEFEWDADGTTQLDGVISGISSVGDEQSEKTADAQYSAYVDFVPDDTVRMGMSAIVYAQTEDDAAAEEAGEEPEMDDGAEPEY